jgi:hypothetical protein
VRPFEQAGGFEPANDIDRIVLKGLQDKGMEPANLCSDTVFVRRVYLDVTGTLPEPQAVRAFLDSTASDKRAALIETLLKDENYAKYWSLKWCDVLRVKAEFPINLWPNAVQAYHRWVYDALDTNMPYDKFARELLTSSGSNFRVPPVNFYRAMQGTEPRAIAAAVGLTFMGVRTDKWTDGQRAAMEVFFSRICYKKTAEWKEEIVCLNPEPCEPFDTTFPDGVKVHVKSYEDPRAVFADWLIRAENEWFTMNIVNRIWAWLLGRGIIEEPDDIRPDNPAVYPGVLDYLSKELVKSGYDLRTVYRLILNSRVYQQSSIPQGDVVKAEAVFACYPVRQLDAEVLIDALCWISGTRESYSSPIPEPFTFIPEEQRTIELADGSITSQFLEMFGRPARDTGFVSERDNDPTDKQRLHMLNSTHVQDKLDKSFRLRGLAKTAKGNTKVVINQTYLNVLSRWPTPAETTEASKYFGTKGIKPTEAVTDLAWALVNSKEFLYRH